MKLCDMRNLVIKKAFGGMKVSFGGNTQLEFVRSRGGQYFESLSVEIE